MYPYGFGLETVLTEKEVDIFSEELNKLTFDGIIITSIGGLLVPVIDIRGNFFERLKSGIHKLLHKDEGDEPEGKKRYITRAEDIYNFEDFLVAYRAMSKIIDLAESLHLEIKNYHVYPRSDGPTISCTRERDFKYKAHESYC